MRSVLVQMNQIQFLRALSVKRMVLMVFLCLVCGCAQVDTVSSDKVQDKLVLGGSNPTDVFDTYQRAVDEKNWRVAISCRVKQEQDQLIAEAIHVSFHLQSARFNKMVAKQIAQEIKQLLEKHNFRKSVYEAATEKNRKLLAEPHIFAAQLLESIDQPLEFYSQHKRLMRGFRKTQDRTRQYIPETKQIAELDNVVVDGDSATGTMFTTSIKGLQEQPAHFRKLGERWFLELTFGDKKPRLD